MSQELLNHLIRSMPKPTEKEQAEIDFLMDLVIEEKRRIERTDSIVNTLQYLRTFLPFEECMLLAKRIGNKQT